MARRPAALLIAFLMAGCQLPPPTVVPSAPATSPAGPHPPSAASSPGSPTPPPGASLAPIGEHRIGIRSAEGPAEFYDRETGERFVPRGANYARNQRDPDGAVVDRVFADYDPVSVEADLAEMKALGYTAVRVALENCRADCIGDPAGGLSSEYLANLADFLRRAKDADLPVFLQSNDLPEEGGFVPKIEATCCSPFDGYLNSQYFHPTGLETYRDYWTPALLGLRAHGAPLDAILAYDLRGELFVVENTPPLSLRTGSVTTANGQTYDLADPAARERLVDEGIVYWVDEIAAAIRAVDPGGLVAVGEFAPNAPNVWRGDDPRAPPTIDTFLRTSVDVIDVHVYPGYVPLAKLMENAGVTGREPVPVVIGEYGAFTFAFPDASAGADGLMRWQAASCDFGVDGWFHWIWSGENDAEVVTGSEGHSAINTVLSPRERPDPCQLGSFPFLQSNVALGADVRASDSAPGQGPELAVDGDEGTGWIAGAGPPGWIEIDLGEPATIDEVRLIVNQSPAGRTVHVVSGGPSRAQLTELHTFEETTDFGDALTWSPGQALTGIRVLRVDTTVSPSWVAWLEIEVMGRRD
ncbi:MAG TPA: discoidin domain-containing protein [Candidatus Limnocylindrales bacterium]|nr:discoidin domain-containing protein [Candidatus Limnocylindrales bacterium]